MQHAEYDSNFITVEFKCQAARVRLDKIETVFHLQETIFQLGEGNFFDSLFILHFLHRCALKFFILIAIFDHFRLPRRDQKCSDHESSRSLFGISWALALQLC